MNRTAAPKSTKPAALLGWMDALADPTRLRLLRLLERAELGVVELCDVLQLPQSTVSRHLKVLSDRGLLRSRRQGTTHLYRMTLDELEPPTRKLWILAREQTEAWATIEQDRLRLDRALKSREQDTQAFFAGTAGQWDKLRRELYGESFATSAMLALLPSEYVVADLGCGTGATAASIAPHVKQVIGVDNSPAMLKAASRRTTAMENVALKRGELEALPVDDGSVDAALLLLVLTYVTDVSAVLVEARRIIKPRGKLVIVDLLPHDRDDFRRQMGQNAAGFPPDSLGNILSGSGFLRSTVGALPPEPSARGPALFLAVAHT